jgi:hypothetical protein
MINGFYVAYAVIPLFLEQPEARCQVPEVFGFWIFEDTVPFGFEKTHASRVTDLFTNGRNQCVIAPAEQQQYGTGTDCRLQYLRCRLYRLSTVPGTCLLPVGYVAYSPSGFGNPVSKPQTREFRMIASRYS